MSEKRCGDCEYFVAFRNYNYETCTSDTITEYCELLQNKDTYDRDKGDEIWNDVFANQKIELRLDGRRVRSLMGKTMDGCRR